MTRSIALAFLLLAVVLMSLPYLAISLNAFVTYWTSGILPGGLTLDVVSGVLTDPRFQAAFGRSLLVAALSLALSILLIVPAILVGHCYWPLLDRWLARLVILPYAVPAVILVVGYLKIFSAPPVAINGTIWILVLSYVPLCFPMLYVSVKNALQGLPVADWLDAARLVGARDEAIFMRVVLPAIAPAILLALVLNLGILLGEFVYANLLVGGRFETLQIYMFAQRSESGRVTSAIVLFYFIGLMAVTAIGVHLSGRRNS